MFFSLSLIIISFTSFTSKTLDVTVKFMHFKIRKIYGLIWYILLILLTNWYIFRLYPGLNFHTFFFFFNLYMYGTQLIYNEAYCCGCGEFISSSEYHLSGTKYLGELLIYMFSYLWIAEWKKSICTWSSTDIFYLNFFLQ